MRRIGDEKQIAFKSYRDDALSALQVLQVSTPLRGRLRLVNFRACVGIEDARLAIVVCLSGSAVATPSAARQRTTTSFDSSRISAGHGAAPTHQRRPARLEAMRDARIRYRGVAIGCDEPDFPQTRHLLAFVCSLVRHPLCRNIRC